MNCFVGTSAVRYFIEDGNRRQLFSINELSGEIVVEKALDHDTLPYVLLSIGAQSGSPALYGHTQVKLISVIQI